MSEEIRIIITDETDGAGTPVATSTVSAKTPRAPTNESEARKASNNGSVAMGLVAVQSIVPYINKIAQMSVSHIEVSTGNAEAQRRAQAVMSATGKAAGSIGTIAAGAAVGGAPGAVIAAATVILGDMLSSFERGIELKNQKILEKESIALRKSRLGLSVNRSRSGGVM